MDAKFILIALLHLTEEKRPAACRTIMEVYVTSRKGTRVRRKYPSLGELKELWEQLSSIEQASFREALLSLGSRAYTASEVMVLRTLEGILRRVYNVEGTLGRLIEKMEKDDRVSDLKSVVLYFKNVRNRIAHPEAVSSKLDAESTFQMIKRLAIEIMKRIGV